MLDSHCHLDFSDYDPDRERVLARAAALGVTRVLVPSTGPERWEATLAQVRTGVRVALGVHPWFGGEVTDLEGWLARPGVVAIGECGLDKHRPDLAAQERNLRAQIALAAALDLPLVLHCVGLHGRLVEILEDSPPVRGVLHSYSGSAELMLRYARLGLYFGFGPMLCWTGVRKARRALMAAPLERLLLESDGPDQPLERGGRSEPADVARVAARVARLRGIPDDALRDQLDQNARALFDWG